MKCQYCGGAVVLEKAYGPYPERLVCISCSREVKQDSPKNDGEEAMSYHLKPEKEEEVKALLETHSIREIIAKTGVAYNTIVRIRDETFTEQEKAELRKRATVRGASRRELRKRDPAADLQKEGQNIPKIIPPALFSNDSNKKGGQEIMTEGTKVCTNPKCPKTNPQPIGEFNKNAARPDGHESRCRTCTAQAQRDRKIAIQKAGDGRKKKKVGRNPRPVRSPSPDPPLKEGVISEAVTLDAQLLRAVKKSAILDFVKNDLPRMVDEAFA